MKSSAIIAILFMILLLTSCTSKEAQSVIDSIAAIGDVSIEKENQINEVNIAYNALSEKDKASVSNYSELQNKIEDLNRLNSELRIASAEKTIDQLTTIDLDSYPLIIEAETTLAALSESEQTKINNIDILNQARSRYQTAIEDQFKAFFDAGDYSQAYEFAKKLDPEIIKQENDFLRSYLEYFCFLIDFEKPNLYEEPIKIVDQFFDFLNVDKTDKYYSLLLEIKGHLPEAKRLAAYNKVWNDNIVYYVSLFIDYRNSSNKAGLYAVTSEVASILFSLKTENAFSDNNTIQEYIQAVEAISDCMNGVVFGIKAKDIDICQTNWEALAPAMDQYISLIQDKKSSGETIVNLMEKRIKLSENE